MKVTECIEKVNVAVEVSNEMMHMAAIPIEDIKEKLDYDMLEEITMQLIENNAVAIKDTTMPNGNIRRTAKLYFLDPNKMDDDLKEKLDL